MSTMKKMAVSAFLLVSGTALAAGYSVDVQGAKATGMATAVTADVNDASAIMFNPAGLAQGPGADVYLGDTLIIPSIQFQGAQGTSSTIPQVVPPPHAYFQFGLDDTWAFGLGVFSPYGSAVRWPSGWQGDGVIISTRLATFNIEPAVAAHFGPVRVGAGLQIVRSTLQLQQGIIGPDFSGVTNAGLGAWGVGGTAGVQWEALHDGLLSLGAAYRSAVSLSFSGNASFTGVPPEFQSVLSDQTVSTHLTLPNTVSLGVASKPIQRLRLGVDVVYFSWQQFSALTLQFQSAPSQTIPKNWHYIWNLHVGGQYDLTEQWAVRAGVLYDPTPGPDSTLAPDLPDSTRVNLAAGLGYTWGPLRADVGYQYVIFTSRTSTFAPLPGKYSGSANVVSLSLGFHL